jgi:hypothetical protein
MVTSTQVHIFDIHRFYNVHIKYERIRRDHWSKHVAPKENYEKEKVRKHINFTRNKRLSNLSIETPARKLQINEENFPFLLYSLFNIVWRKGKWRKARL